VTDVAVVVADLTGNSARTVETVRIAAARTKADAEIVAVGHGHRPDCAADSSLEALPLGGAYVRNRGLALVSAPIVAFVDGGLAVHDDWLVELLAELTRAAAVVGAVSPASRLWPRLSGRLALASPLWTTGPTNAAFSRARLLTLGGFSRAPARGGDAEVFLRLARANDVVAWNPRAVAHGRRTRVVPATPAELLARLPSELAGTLPAQPQPHSHSHPAKTRFSYSVGPDLMLHLQGNPLSRLERAVRERETIRRRASVGGIPRLVASAEAPDAVWLLEERLPGRHPDTAAADEWFDAAADWAVGMAGPPGPPLDEVPSWAEYRRALVDFAPPEIRERVEQAVEAVSELRAVHMHGDLQPLNLVVEDGIVGAIDWEGAWLEGLPGLDLLFLALFADGAGPDVAVLERLARGEDLPRRALVPRLRRLGIEPELLPDLVVASLAVWALSERRRLARLGSPSRPPVFLPLLRRFSA
jgi:hypothetical protein